MRTKEKFLKLIDSKNPEGGLWTFDADYSWGNKNQTSMNHSRALYNTLDDLSDHLESPFLVVGKKAMGYMAINKLMLQSFVKTDELTQIGKLLENSLIKGHEDTRTIRMYHDNLVCSNCGAPEHLIATTTCRYCGKRLVRKNISNVLIYTFSELEPDNVLYIVDYKMEKFSLINMTNI